MELQQFEHNLHRYATCLGVPYSEFANMVTEETLGEHRSSLSNMLVSGITDECISAFFDIVDCESLRCDTESFARAVFKAYMTLAIALPVPLALIDKRIKAAGINDADNVRGYIKKYLITAADYSNRYLEYQHGLTVDSKKLYSVASKYFDYKSHKDKGSVTSFAHLMHPTENDFNAVSKVPLPLYLEELIKGVNFKVELLDLLVDAIFEEAFDLLYAMCLVLYDTVALRDKGYVPFKVAPFYTKVLVETTALSFSKTKNVMPIGVLTETYDALMKGKVVSKEDVAASVARVSIPAQFVSNLTVAESNPYLPKIIQIENDMVRFAEKAGMSFIELIDDVRLTAADSYKNTSVAEMLENTWEAYKHTKLRFGD